MFTALLSLLPSMSPLQNHPFAQDIQHNLNLQ